MFFLNTLYLRFPRQNTAKFWFKICLDSTFWLADLNWDQAYLPIREKNVYFDLCRLESNLDPFFGHKLSHLHKRAQNGNLDSILAYSIFRPFQATGLIGAFLIAIFRIPAIRAYNTRLPVLLAEKPALLFPFSWQIFCSISHNYRLRKRTPVLNVLPKPISRS